MEVTPSKAVAEASGKSTSPSNVGIWNVSSVEKKAAPQQNGVSPAVANGWEKPLEDGEIEYFVAAKKSPKRRSLYKAPSAADELAAEKHSPIRDVIFVGLILNLPKLGFFFRERRTWTVRRMFLHSVPRMPSRRAQIPLKRVPKQSLLRDPSPLSGRRRGHLFPTMLWLL